MPETLVPLRNALAEAYMGDTKVVKDLFSSHETYDQRMVEILTGLGQHVDVRQPSAISTADIAECLRALSAENQAYRVALMNFFARSFATTAGQVSFGTAVISGANVNPFPDYSLYKTNNAYSSFVMCGRNISFQSLIALDFDSIFSLGQVFPLSVCFTVKIPLGSAAPFLIRPFVVPSLWDFGDNDSVGMFGGKRVVNFSVSPAFYADHLTLELSAWAPDEGAPLLWPDLATSRYHSFSFSFSFNDIAP